MWLSGEDWFGIASLGVEGSTTIQANDRRDVAASGPEGAAHFAFNAATMTRCAV
jgi:hypothetical protein